MATDASDQRSARDRALGFLLAAIVLVAFLVFVFVPPERMNPATLPIIRFLAAMAGALSTYLFIGSMELHGLAPDAAGRIKLKAGGSFAVFVIIILLFYWGLPANTSDVNPRPHSQLQVTPVPDTISIDPDAFATVEYVFSESRNIDVDVETQDNQFYTVTGLPLGPPCHGCRLLGGGFKVRGGQTYRFRDNVYLPKDRAEELRVLKAEALQLNTLFNCRDAAGGAFTGKVERFRIAI